MALMAQPPRVKLFKKNDPDKQTAVWIKQCFVLGTTYPNGFCEIAISTFENAKAVNSLD